MTAFVVGQTGIFLRKVLRFLRKNIITMHMRKGNVLPIALMALAIIGFLVLVSWAVTPGLKWPWSVNAEKTATNTINTNITANVNISANTNSVSNSNTLTNTNTVSTADWKTYTNSTLGYSIQYPPSWTIENHAITGILVTPPTSEVPGKEWGINRQIYIKALATQDELASVENQVRKTINGVEVIQGEFSPSSYATVDTYFPKGSGFIKVTWATTYDNTTFQEILSTLTLASPTADWKTYTNTALGFSLKYPSEYAVRVNDQSNITQVIWSTESTTVMEVQYRVDSVDGSLSTWYDSEPIEDIALGDKSGKKFIYRYCDGPGCGSDTVAYVVKHSSRLLGLEFVGDKTIDTTENQILSTFNFTK